MGCDYIVPYVMEQDDIRNMQALSDKQMEVQKIWAALLIMLY